MSNGLYHEMDSKGDGRALRARDVVAFHEIVDGKASKEPTDSRRWRLLETPVQVNQDGATELERGLVLAEYWIAGDDAGPETMKGVLVIVNDFDRIGIGTLKIVKVPDLVGEFWGGGYSDQERVTLAHPRGWFIRLFSNRAWARLDGDNPYGDHFDANEYGGGFQIVRRPGRKAEVVLSSEDVDLDDFLVEKGLTDGWTLHSSREIQERRFEVTVVRHYSKTILVGAADADAAETDVFDSKELDREIGWEPDDNEDDEVGNVEEVDDDSEDDFDDE